MHSPVCKYHDQDKMQYAIWRRNDDLGGDMLIDILENLVLFNEFEYMRDNKTNKDRIRVINYVDDHYQTYQLNGKFCSLLSDEETMEVFSRNSNGILGCFLTHNKLYEVGICNMTSLCQLDKGEMNVELLVQINKPAFNKIKYLIKTNVEHKITLFGRRDLDPLTNLLNREWILQIDSIKLAEAADNNDNKLIKN